MPPQLHCMGCYVWIPMCLPKIDGLSTLSCKRFQFPLSRGRLSCRKRSGTTVFLIIEKVRDVSGPSGISDTFCRFAEGSWPSLAH